VTSWTLGRRLAAALVFAALVLLAVGGVAATALTRVGASQHRVTGTLFSAIESSHALFSAHLEQETGVRGYALSGERRLLSPYEQGRRAERAANAELDRVLVGETELRADLAAVRTASAAWQRRFAGPTIAAVDARGKGALGPGDVIRGDLLFTELRAANEAYARRVLDERARAITELDRARRTLVLVLVTGLVLLGVAAVLLTAALRRWVVAPLDSLGHEVRAVAAGDLHRHVEGTGPPEIVRLGGDAEHMRSQLLAAYRQAVAAREVVEDQREQLELQAVDLLRSNAELEQFAYVASHDLQEPLRKVASFSQLLQRRYAGRLDERADQYIDFAVDGAKRMQQLINDLLAFSRVGRLTSEFTEVDGNWALHQALRNLADQVEETQARVESDPLPTVRGEAGLLTQVFQNLLGNAMKFARPGHPPHVTVTCRPAGDAWEFAVADNGIGLDPQYADRIFVIFQRLHRKEDYGGTGIGLAMCKKIVEYHGGRIWLDETVSSGSTGIMGTTMRFTLPTLESAISADRPHESGVR
jgi:signal transduction histidine kinase